MNIIKLSNTRRAFEKHKPVLAAQLAKAKRDKLVKFIAEQPARFLQHQTQQHIERALATQADKSSKQRLITAAMYNYLTRLGHAELAESYLNASAEVEL